MFEARFVNALNANTALVAVVKSIAEAPLAQGTHGTAYPCITFNRSSTVRPYSHQSICDLQRIRVQVRCFALNDVVARQVADLFIATLPTFDLTVPETDPITVSERSANKFQSQFPAPEVSPEPAVSCELVDCIIWYRE